MIMNSIPNPPSELFYKFNDVKYYDEPHKYYVNDQQLTSVTTVIHKYDENFDENKWAKIKANQYNLKSNDIKYAWKFINEKATTKGSIIHDYTENLFLNKIFPYPKDMVINKFGYDAVWYEYIKTKKHVDKFYNRVKNILIPIKTELVCYDLEFLIGGMVDMLFYNVRTKKFEIWDYKTNSAPDAFNEDPRFITNLKDPLFLLQNTALDIYSLQLSIYKYILLKHTPIELGNSYVVWFSCNNESYEIKETHDYTHLVEELLIHHKNNFN